MPLMQGAAPAYRRAWGCRLPSLLEDWWGVGGMHGRWKRLGHVSAAVCVAERGRVVRSGPRVGLNEGWMSLAVACGIVCNRRAS
jgi:hypothetical protein